MLILFHEWQRRGSGTLEQADDCSLEDIQYHLYVIEKVRHGLESADTQGTISQEKLNGVWRNGLLSRMVVEGR